MPGNTIGKIYTLRSFGESHGAAIGGIIDGCPPGLQLSTEAIQRQLERRRPGASDIATPRDEPDKLEILSGLFRGITTGAPVGFLVRNRDAREQAYDNLEHTFRPSHADYTWQAKYGIRDHRGGGRSSAREHVARVVAGAIAAQYLALAGIQIRAHTSRVGHLHLQQERLPHPAPLREESPIGCPDPLLEREMIALIRDTRRAGDSIGGVVTCVIRGVPPGVGEPVFDRFQARLAHYMMSINAAKGFEYGEGFDAATARGSQHNDSFRPTHSGGITTATNHSGGIQGGITNGEEIYFRVAFKPIPTISIPQQTVTSQGQETELAAAGRHDPCVIPRVLPVVEAMAAMLTLDMMLEGNHYPSKITGEANSAL
ncbi:MAG: chorismate synthase [Odoribacteraceae bacterium]|jgi:chorismate synthase|nr:chorismate synthase [Odoribacteraceae bacterium]